MLALFALGVMWESRGLPLGTFREPGPAYLPVLLALILMAFGLLLVARGAQARPLPSTSWKEGRHAAAILMVSALAAFGMERLGFRLTVLLILALLVKFVERKGWALTVVYALALAFGSFYLFHSFLRVPLPVGPMGI